MRALAHCGSRPETVAPIACGGFGLTAFAEFERALILERQREGIAATKQRGGVYTGRKPALTAEQAQQLRERAAAGEKKSALAREFGISRETVYSYLRPAAVPG